jgi:hypothetical protein
MFHAVEHDLIALEPGALDRSHERAAHIIRLEVSYWHVSDPALSLGECPSST